ncbi:hypothetical protein P43SY_002163 [Pythium insidiosum]|uniref:Uncharacterized protein n=1 Tax=Pythium insidiosum TaxID=114742 RepID=A0AAD5LD44_PYTIN|nr:hypothetical protein P43SY_002163 [Pythium insidiosum]
MRLVLVPGATAFAGRLLAARAVLSSLAAASQMNAKPAAAAAAAAARRVADPTAATRPLSSAQPPPLRATRRRRTYSSFLSSPSAWQDRIALEQRQREQQRSPFVQQQLARFKHQRQASSSASVVRSPVAASHLRGRLQLRNNPQAAARLNALLRARDHYSSGRLSAQVPVRPRADGGRLKAPARAAVPAIQRFSRRRRCVFLVD